MEEIFVHSKKFLFFYVREAKNSKPDFPFKEGCDWGGGII